MEYLGLVISILALGFSTYTYIIHDQKIKKQEKILNDYQINEIEIRKIESKKAKIETHAVKINAGRNFIKVYNKGQSIARNVNVLLDPSANLVMRGNPCPIDINPQHNIELLVFLSTSSPAKVKVELEWDDDYKEKNKVSQYVQLL